MRTILPCMAVVALLALLVVTPSVTARMLAERKLTQALTPAQAAQQIVENINLITQKSQALQSPAQSISIVNGPLIVIGQGPFPQIITGFTDIVSTATTAISQMQGYPAIPAGTGATDVFNAFRDFVMVHQQLLSILIGKAGLFNTVPIIGQPVAQVLRSVESVVDTIAFALINMVQSESAGLTDQQNSLDMTLQTAISSYSGVDLN